jgi:hypothetical protein
LREKASPQMEALDGMEFRKIFMIFAYLSGWGPPLFTVFWSKSKDYSAFASTWFCYTANINKMLSIHFNLYTSMDWLLRLSLFSKTHVPFVPSKINLWGKAVLSMWCSF